MRKWSPVPTPLLRQAGDVASVPATRLLWRFTDVGRLLVNQACGMSPMSSATRRRLYAGGHPHRLARVLNRTQMALHSAGIWPKRLATLEVRGRRSGRLRSLPVVIADYEGERYLVSMLGEGSAWVANVRAAGGRVVLRHGRRESIVLEEVEPGGRAPILRRYLEVATAARAHFPVDRRAPLSEFEPIASQYPVFRVSSEA